ncbi:hypothetical protein CVT26_010086 [Gymnopilus dilepis]|uniref:Uncharacterized protein n=1 Tax=Gymnopilus dilepis TaxID=231916 RepID=A0A409WTE1_9AGAR|nr:hypothetical protein CVT26_010086 [Gymnopilus dilepis]
MESSLWTYKRELVSQNAFRPTLEDEGSYTGTAPPSPVLSPLQESHHFDSLFGLSSPRSQEPDIDLDPFSSYSTVSVTTTRPNSPTSTAGVALPSEREDIHDKAGSSSCISSGSQTPLSTPFPAAVFHSLAASTSEPRLTSSNEATPHTTHRLRHQARTMKIEENLD